MIEPDDSALCLIGLCGAEGVGAVTLALLRRAAAERGIALCEAAGLGARVLQKDLGLPAAAARAVATAPDPIEAGRATWRDARRAGLLVIAAGGPHYPAPLATHLGEAAPPVLFLAGEAGLLRRRLIAIVGSRRPSRAAAQAARALAADCAARGMTVVSGGARGIDTAAHLAAAPAGGTAIVPATGLACLLRDGLAGRPLPASPWCGLGQFPLHARWRTSQALLRNRTIVALGEAVVAFEPRDSGGTRHSSLAALRMGKPLFVVSPLRAGPKGRGFRRLVRLGAVALDPARMPEGPDLDRLIADYRPPPGADQLCLFDQPAGSDPRAERAEAAENDESRR